MWILFTCMGAIFLILFLARRKDAPSAGALMFKTLTSVCFLGLSFAAVCGRAFEARIATETHTELLAFPMLVCAGQFFGLLGDIWLDLKFIHPEEDRRYTNAGFVSFAAGHIFFIEALSLRFWQEGFWWLFLPALLSVLFGIFLLPIGKKMGMDFGSFRGITVIYGMILCFVMLFSVSLLIKNGGKHPALWRFTAGTVLFAASDLVLGGTYFGTGKNRPVDIILNHVLYYAAQFLIAAAACL